MELEQKDQDIVRLFNALPALPPSRELFTALFLSYELHRQRMARIRFAFLSITAVVSLVSLIPGILFSIHEFSQSGFGEYLSLIFSDTSNLLPYSKEFGLSLIESAPIVAATVVLLSLFVFLGSLKIAGKNYKTAFMHIGTTA